MIHQGAPHQSGPLKENRSVEKTFRILEAMASYQEPVPLGKLAELVGCPSSTTLRFLRTLIGLGYVGQDAQSQRYFLTFQLCRLSSRIRSAAPLNRIALPIMEKLMRRCGESVCLAVEQEERAVYIEVVDGPDHMVKSLQRIGSSSPLHCTGVGKLLLLNRSPEELNAFFQGGPLTRFTQNTLTSPEAVRSALEEVRRRGYAVDNEECEIGARCAAFPIRDFTGKIVAGLSVTGTVFHINDEFIRKHAPDIQAASMEISGILGYTDQKD